MFSAVIVLFVGVRLIYYTTRTINAVVCRRFICQYCINNKIKSESPFLTVAKVRDTKVTRFEIEYRIQSNFPNQLNDISTSHAPMALFYNRK